MAYLHGKLKNGKQGIQLDFFFTARGEMMQRTPLGMLRSLLNQIFDCDVTVRPQVREAYEQRCRQFGYGEGMWEWPQLVLEELLAGVILSSASRQPVTVFIDALDETGVRSAQQLTAYFHRLIDRAAKRNAAVRICISCRHYPIIASAQAMEIPVEQHNCKDIALYIKDVLTEIEVDNNPSEDMREMLMEQLIQQANGVFQWAHLIMPLARQRIFEGESYDDICCWLREVPAGLEEVYIYILKNVIEERNLEQSFSLFQWVCLAERPLTVIEMRYALAARNAQITRAPETWEKINGFIESDERMKRRIKVLSGGLVEVVPSGAAKETVQVVHQSVNDFLRAKGLAVLSDNIGARSPALEREQILLQCQANLYRSCLFYLALLRIRGDISNNFWEKRGETREDLIQSNPLLTYATANLFIHAEKAGHSRVLILPNELDILRQVLGRWVQIYRVLNPFNPACPPIRTTIIHMAAAANLVDIIECVSWNSGDVASKDAGGNTAFHLAARYGHISVGRMLREKAANSSYGHTGFVEWLLCEGVNFEATRGKGDALLAASSRGHPNVVKILLGAGANVNAQGGRYGNALQAAVYRRKSEIVKILLDAGADVNAQGGEYGNALQAAGGLYGSSLLAAVYEGNAEQVQILLRAGANALLADELERTPLHIAASKNRLDILHRFPELFIPINNRDKFLQAPLHLAICLGHIEFAMKLLHFGANPSLLDGYGRNTLDWVIGNESLVHQIQNHYPSIVVTPNDTQEFAVRQSILQVSDTLLQSQLKRPWPLLQQLGRYLLFLNDEDNARCLFQLHFSQETYPGTTVYQPTCDLCTRVINGSRSVCRTCAHMDLCSTCVQKHPFHSRLHPNQEHKTFEVSQVLDQESPLPTSVSEELRKYIDKFSAPSSHGSGNRSSKDSLALWLSKITAPEERTLIPMALGPISVISLLLLGLGLGLGLIACLFG
ncbi:hypothetical protein N7520_001830 [Penicillium odoratum]|uniref:uncharacterized protein n=1 Tax=Penicillium odoratum TaxID=1167516 RepID=UPI002548819A|nr:uncharacterized protein N7520_001830 [Penicillium odoratum]KAJ5778584.1 hypothetical protein N7520_001830 [Penicillium odoratum]